MAKDKVRLAEKLLSEETIFPFRFPSGWNVYGKKASRHIVRLNGEAFVEGTFYGLENGKFELSFTLSPNSGMVPDKPQYLNPWGQAEKLLKVELGKLEFKAGGEWGRNDVWLRVVTNPTELYKIAMRMDVLINAVASILPEKVAK